MRERRKIPFKIWMIIYVLLGFAAIAAVMLVLWSFARRYEDTRIYNAVDPVVQELNEGRLPETAVEAITSIPDRVQSDEECVEYVKSLLTGKIYYTVLPEDRGSGSVVYSLHCGTNEIGKAVFVQEEEEKFGLRGWKLESESFDFGAFTSEGSVTVPEDCTVSVGGRTLGEENIAERGIHFKMLEELYGEYGGVPCKVSYSVKNYFGTPVFDVTDINGSSVVIDGNTPEEELLDNCTDEERARLSDFTERFVYRYAVYSSGVSDPYAEYNNLAPYILSGSDFWYRMIQARDGLSWMRAISRMNVDMSSLDWAIRLEDNVYLLRISATITTYDPYRKQVTTDNSWNAVVIDNNGDLRVSVMDTE